MRSILDDQKRRADEAQLEFNKKLEGLDEDIHLARGEFQALRQKVGGLRESIDRFRKGSSTEPELIRELDEFNREFDRREDKVDRSEERK